jgi:hypothetical protein
MPSGVESKLGKEGIGMDLRFYEDPVTGQPLIYGHGVTEREVREVLRGPGEDLRATGNSRRKIGQTLACRLLQVLYVPDEDFGISFRGYWI